MRNDDNDALVADLRALGQELTVPTQDELLVTKVMTRLADEPVPSRSRRAETVGRAGDWLRTRRKAVAAALTAVVVALALTPPVRAAVAEWFGFGGVIVREDPGPGPTSAPPPPAAGSRLALEDAGALVGFDPMVPAELGRPDGVAVSDDRRVLSLSWRDAGETAVRLDEFDGRLAPVFGKLAATTAMVDVDGVTYLWFSAPHEVVVLDHDGRERTETARLAGRTLIWERDGMTLRLEGEMSMDRAITIARSAAPLRR